jgi:AcrR family transcriptional regulator
VRARLVDAATELAVEQGFEACGLREIAARADVSPGMISYYFGDRQGLYEAIFQRAFDRISGKVSALMSDQGRTGGDRLDELIRIQVTAIAADPWLPKLIMREMLARGDSPVRDFVGRAVGQGPLQRMIQWLEEEQANHVIHQDFDPRMLAITIVSLTGFPFLLLPTLGDEIGLQLDEDFPDRLIKHNQKILANALRAPTEKRE